MKRWAAQGKTAFQAERYLIHDASRGIIASLKREEPKLTLRPLDSTNRASGCGTTLRLTAYICALFQSSRGF
jgi:hypothetical protein